MDFTHGENLGRHYAVTISLPPSSNRAIFDHNALMRPIRRWFNMFSNHYCLYPELADETARLHYHGIVQINDMTKFKHIKTSIDKNLGWIKIEKFKNFRGKLGWLMYCQKEWAGNRRLFKQPIMYERLKRAAPKSNQEPKRLITDYFK